MVAIACSSSSGAEKLCTPDAYVFCRCQDRSQGTKKCVEDGASFEACLPCDGTGTPGPGSDPGRPDPLSKPLGESDALTSAGDTKNDTDKATDKPKSDAGTTTPSESKKPDTSSAKGNPDTAVSYPDVPHCKPMKNVAPKIEIQKIADSPTKPIGGVPNDGVYVQGWVVQFTGDDGESGPTKRYSRQTLEITGDVGRYSFEEDNGLATQGGFRLTPTSDGKVNVAYECPATTEPRDLAYDATASTITIYDPPYARVFFRQTSGNTK